MADHTLGFEFGPFRLDLLTHRLFRGDVPVPLTPKAIDTLQLLLEHRNRVVGKEELMKALWPDSFVEESNVAQHVFTLRKALGTDSDGQLFIETIPKRGYRFTAPVREITGLQQAERAQQVYGPADAPARSVAGDPNTTRAGIIQRTGWWLVAAMLVALASAAVVVWRSRVADQERFSAVLAGVDTAIGRNDLDGVQALLAAAGVEPTDPRLAAVADRIIGSLSVDANIVVSVRATRARLDVSALSGESLDLGRTPISNRPLVAGDYVVELSGPDVLSAKTLVHVQPGTLARVNRTLATATELSAGMAFVESGDVHVGADIVRVPAFFIDQHEVTNGEFQRFVAAGKYQDAAFWPEVLVVGGRTLPRARALSLFVDRTGFPGPRTWSNGRYPEGKQDHPVVGVSWYEAAAYARWAGRELPTFAQWRRAAVGTSSSGFPWGTDVKTAEQRANFGLVGTTPASAYPAGLSPFGCADMAGNAREWLRNEAGDARHPAAGASWLEPAYDFELLEWFDAAQATPGIGFRLVTSLPGDEESDETVTLAPTPSAVAGRAANDTWIHTPVDDRSFEAMARLFAYDASAPLDVRVSETREDDGIIIERLTFHSAPSARVSAFLMHTAASAGRPGVVLLHSAGATGKDLPNNVALGMLMVRSGWSVIAIDLPFFGERATDLLTTFSDEEKHSQLYNQPGVYLAWMSQAVRDVRRAYDLLVQQTGADPEHIALVGASRGAIAAMVTAGVDQRFRPVALLFAGHATPLEVDHFEAACPANYITRIAPRPLLMLNSVNDQTFPPQSAVRPLFELAGQPKDIIWTTGGHMVLTDSDTAAVMSWLREKIG